MDSGLWSALIFASCLFAAAQPTSPPPTDPLMALMLSQPPIDVTSPVVPTAVFDPPVVRPGEAATYRVQFNALEASIEWPAQIPAPAGLLLHPGAHGQMLALGSVLQPRTGFNYHVRPAEPGLFTIPAFTVTVYGKPVTVPAAQLEVTAATSAGPPVPPTPSLILEAPRTNLYVGQALRVNIIIPALPGGMMLLPLQQPPVQVTGEGLVVDQSSTHQRPELRPGLAGGLAFETTLTPIAAGKLSAFAQTFVGNQPGGASITISGRAGPVTLGGGPPRYLLLDSDPVELNVRPLPRGGELPGFTGAVGTYAVDRPELAANALRVGEPVKLTVKVRGEGNLARLVPPPPPHVSDWQVLASSAENLPPPLIQARGYAAFSYTLIPLTEKARATPAIPFSCFDPEHAAYLDLTIPSVPVTVQPGAGPADLAALLRANTLAAEPTNEPALSGLAATPGLAAGSLVPLQQQGWFPLVQLAPAAAFLGLWGWDRRRRFRELHPDLIRRRRARRALRRQWRALHQAARVGDAPRFAALAVKAMRIASAPHYPAEPRALVGSDVLAVLPPAERSGRPGEIVRRFFAVTDAARFNTDPPDAGQLLALQPELADVLRELEEKLCD